MIREQTRQTVSAEGGFVVLQISYERGDHEKRQHMRPQSERFRYTPTQARDLARLLTAEADAIEGTS